MGLCGCAGFSLLTESEGHSLVVVLWSFIVGASLAAEHGLWGAQASVAEARGLLPRSRTQAQLLRHTG